MNASNPITLSTKLDMQESSDQERQASDALATHTTENEVGTSRLMELPPELRNRIWEYTLSVGTVYVRVEIDSEKLRAYVVDDSSKLSTDEQTIMLQGPFGTDVGGADVPAGVHCLTLLKTCKQIHHEAGKLFYFCNHFEIKAFDPLSNVNPRSGLMLPGLFEFGEQTPREILTGMRKFEGWIGAKNAQAITRLTFSLGQLDPYEIDITKHMLVGPLREIHLAHASWRLHMNVAFMMRDRDGDIRCRPVQHVVMSVAEPATGLEAAVKKLEQRKSEWLQLQVDGHQVDDLGKFAKYCQELRKAVMTSAQ
ncbi:hypothetical protein LTR56_009446 [Elasticomyces elasticus]|nr:hypothetical protein LTR56_009446 [Elasticomyces elasticus]KAK3645878.1 hypothetical protein LTR22_014544 [Elasticomyces elasticus]KAK4931034.1 hypothetical protein LTR49_002449 [Elasticomyces elasticus]KAK5765501.1 hypothetical protein LTS12_004252 [Elasticomyces elasticus]